MRASHSKIQCYKSCRRLYFLKYVEGLKSTTKFEALERGMYYHDMVDGIYKNGFLSPTFYPKYNAMATAYQKYIYPQFNIKESEEWFEYLLEDHILVGRIDGQTDTEILVEHKTVSSEINEEYMYQLQFDEQVLTYMMAQNVRNMIYTICRVPTIRQRQNETSAEYMERCCEWYEIDTNKKIASVSISRTKQQITTHRADTVALLDEMEQCNLFYRNTDYCNKWGRFCEYSNICLDYSPDKNYIGFERKEKL